MMEKLYQAKVKFLDNPRKELAENELEVDNTGLKSLGFEPIKLSNRLVDDVLYIAQQMKDNMKKENILTSPRW